MLVEGFGGGLPAEGLAGPAIDRGGDGFDLLGGPTRQVGSFGEVLAQQTVGVLVGAALRGGSSVSSNAVRNPKKRSARP